MTNCIKILLLLMICVCHHECKFKHGRRLQGKKIKVEDRLETTIPLNYYEGLRDNYAYSDENYTRFAYEGEFLFMASVRLKHSVVHFCTGALITEYLVASVATCFVRIKPAENLYTFPDVQNIVVQLGSRYLETKVDPTFTIVEVENVLLHPKIQVDIRGNKNDAAILVIKHALPQQIKPVSFISYSEDKLINQFTILNNNELFCQLLGWAESPPSPVMADEQRIADDLISEALQVLKVRLIQDDECLYLLCNDNRNMCSLNLSDLNLFCVQAVKTLYGSCRSYVGNSLICGGLLWGLGSALTAGLNPCDGKNLPMVMLRPELFISTMYRGIKVHVPMKSEAFTTLPFIVFIVTITVVLLHF